ncbi:MAG: hypothetical protein Q8922_13205 [Bacteroidota bacterium]|nr:hypothetical protein [Bacteroidota bacterium]MDP4232777.1 hypothetical protein [Bacteroidota bacterium]MDP4242541.1 hypothetical protein [Bacteroidota bacterium]MDP4288880.1 hypothetical protein [Bacteroidota bacterium]
MIQSKSIPLRKRIAELAFFLFLISVGPVVYAAAEIEQKQWRRTPITRIINQRQRSRALYRRYGAILQSPFVPQIVPSA